MLVFGGNEDEDEDEEGQLLKGTIRKNL